MHKNTVEILSQNEYKAVVGLKSRQWVIPVKGRTTGVSFKLAGRMAWKIVYRECVNCKKN